MKAEIIRKTAAIEAVDAEKQVAYGWACIYEKAGRPYVDLQGDTISEDEVLKMAHGFMNSRASKTMHAGKQTGEVVESVVFTRDVQRALGIDLGKCGWLVGIHIDDPVAWKRVKRGELRGFSIGGRGIRTPAK